MDLPAAPDVEEGVALSLCNMFLPAASARPGAKLLLTVSAHCAEGRARLVVALDGLAGQETLDILVPCTGTSVVEAPLLTSSG